MKISLRLPLTVLILSLLTAAIGFSGGNEKFDLKALEGDWEGRGEFLMPVTHVNVGLEGAARFDYDSTGGYLRTSMTGEKFFFTYSDSGHLVMDNKTDSISWEVWDNFGKHTKYFGTVDGNKVTGDRYKKKHFYNVTIELVTADSIDFKLTVTDPDGDKYTRAAFYLWRVKD